MHAPDDVLTHVPGQLIYHCAYCGHEWTEENPVSGGRITTICCGLCSVLNPRPGTIVKYAAWDRPGHLPPYSPARLTPNALYTIARVKQWQHGTVVWLRETGTASFNVLLFTPKTFQREE